MYNENLLVTYTLMIPVAKPLLPNYLALRPYLERIDNNRFYSNNGPLLNSLESRLSEALDCKERSVVATSSATSALEIVLASNDFAQNSRVMMPSFTFIASAQAVLRAGLRPIFSDVDLKSWALTPDLAETSLKRIKNDDPPVAVLVVAPFGIMPCIKEWEEFAKKTGLKVIIDAAAVNFENVIPSANIPIVISMHATKLLTAGEGGLIISRDYSLLEEVKRRTNFGLGDRSVTEIAGNSKLSEYHAAIGLSSLDIWERRKECLISLSNRYKLNLSDQNGINLFQTENFQQFNSTYVVESHRDLESHLIASEIGSRKWWRLGCHREPVFGAQNIRLKNTDYLANRYLGLPMFPDLKETEIDFISEIIILSLNKHGQAK